jgi:hypothetical protein
MMNRYQQPTFRPVFGLAAAAMSAVTLAVLVVLPMSLATACEGESTLARAPATVVSMVPDRVEVVATPVRTVLLDRVKVVARRGRDAG